jgi:hypothetical protein
VNKEHGTFCCGAATGYFGAAYCTFQSQGYCIYLWDFAGAGLVMLGVGLLIVWRRK